MITHDVVVLHNGNPSCINCESSGRYVIAETEVGVESGAHRCATDPVAVQGLRSVRRQDCVGDLVGIGEVDRSAVGGQESERNDKVRLGISLLIGILKWRARSGRKQHARALIRRRSCGNVYFLTIPLWVIVRVSPAKCCSSENPAVCVSSMNWMLPSPLENTSVI